MPVATRNEAITAAHTIGVAARTEGGQNGEEAVVHEAAEDQRPRGAGTLTRPVNGGSRRDH